MIAIMRALSEDMKHEYEDMFSEPVLCVDKYLSEPHPEVTSLVANPNVTAAFLAHFPNLKLLFTVSAGVDQLPFDYIRKAGIILTNSQGLHAEHMSEHALAMLLTHTRQIDLAIRAQAAHHWTHREGTFTTVHGKSLCIVGAGTIGHALARKATALGMTVTGVSRHGRQHDGYQEMYATSQLIQAVSEADVVVLLLPLTAETYHLFDQQVFSAMKKGSIFINVSRGETVDTSGLIQALNAGQLAFAGLDVFEDEPLPEDSVLWDMPHVLVTPHVGGRISDYDNRALLIFSDILADYRKGGEIRNRVDLDLRY